MADDEMKGRRDTAINMPSEQKKEKQADLRTEVEQLRLALQEQQRQLDQVKLERDRLQQHQAGESHESF